jgi:hypothetical protein
MAATKVVIRARARVATTSTAKKAKNSRLGKKARMHRVNAPKGF